MTTLSRLLLPLRNGSLPLAALAEDGELGIVNLSKARFDELLALAHSNHVVVRALNILLEVMRFAHDDTRAEWAEVALAAERGRIRHALPFLHEICAAFQAESLDITVIKSLDHWPDLGSDLDLFTNASPQAVLQLMQRRFGAQLAPRSWGDRLAQKWNYVVPGVPESMEFHIGRLGQTGEQRVLARRLPKRAHRVQIEGEMFPVPHASDRLMISTLQRMYRHFYFRLCDVVDSATLVASGAVDYDDLQKSAMAAGIWEGVATYLVIVSDYIKRYGDRGLDLPENVTSTARFGGDCVYFAREFIRVPIVPQAAKLYRSQLAGLLRRGELHSSARLGLLPWLATAAFVEHKRTGSDKGIW
jgi:hypothetical protein